MKAHYKFILFIVVLITFTFGMQMNIPKQFSWEPTFSHTDRNPFGCYVLDSVLATTMPHGYSVKDKTLYQLSGGKKPQAVMIISNKLSLSNIDVKAIKKIANQGGKVMIIGKKPNYAYDDSTDVMMTNFGIAPIYNYSSFNVETLRYMIQKSSTMLYDTLYWESEDHGYSQKEFPIYEMLVDSKVKIDSVHVKNSLAYRKRFHYEYPNDSDRVNISESISIAAKRKYGKGEIIVVACPLLFTNYGILDATISEYVMRIMTEVKDLPVVRTQTYMNTPKDEAEETSPLRFFLSQPPLKWAIYLLMLTIIIFMIFTARRRQRVIPIIKDPINRSLEFNKLIGTLYYQKHDNTDLVRKKYTYFAEEIRRKIGVDVEDTNDNDHIFNILSNKTGLPYEEIANTIKHLRIVINYELNININEMRDCIDMMNNILKQI